MWNKLSRESTFLLLPGKITCLGELGDVFFKESQIDNGVKSFKSALEQAKIVYPGQPPHIKILNNFGVALGKAGMLDESLRYLQEGKEILDNHKEITLHIDGDHTSYIRILSSIGASYAKLGKFFLAFQSYKNALDSLDMTIISDKFYGDLCHNMAITLIDLNRVALSKEDAQKIVQTMKLSRKKEHKNEKRFKDICRYIVFSYYQMSLSLRRQREHDKVLECLERAREMAKSFDYKCGRVVLVLLLLSMNYGETESFDKSRSCYEEAKEMAKSLPPEDDSILPGELGMIEWMKKDCQRNYNIERL